MRILKPVMRHQLMKQLHHRFSAYGSAGPLKAFCGDAELLSMGSNKYHSSFRRKIDYCCLSWSIQLSLSLGRRVRRYLFSIRRVVFFMSLHFVSYHRVKNTHFSLFDAKSNMNIDQTVHQLRPITSNSSPYTVPYCPGQRRIASTVDRQ